MEYRDFRLTLRTFPPFLLVALTLAGAAAAQQDQSAAELVEQFKATKIFWRQFEVAQKIVKLHDVKVLSQLEPWLSNEDRHLRGNAAFIFAALGDNRGFEVIRAILNDRSDRPPGQGFPSMWSLQEQIRADRYYAVHLCGDLKDARAVPILIPLLQDNDVNWIVPWALGEIGDKSAVPALIQTLSDPSPDMRVLAIYALEKLGAKEALPNLRALLADEEKSHFDKMVSVAEAANAAIIKLRNKP